ncbi:MAG: hypothetical protein K2M30_05180, partial [Desulfovibrionaceae bacterium]|nr:hypothetical protein [Desulfovibrionaceae bacterium]
YIFILQVALATGGLFFGFMESSFFPFLVFLYPLIIYHLSITEKNRKQLLYKVFILATISGSINLYWVSYPLLEIGRLPLLATYFVVILIAIALSIFPLFFSYIIFYTKK